MATVICASCRHTLRQAHHASIKQTMRKQRQSAAQSTLTRPSRVQPTPPKTSTTAAEIAALLSKPTWSVRSLLPSKPESSTPSNSNSGPNTTDEAVVTPKTLRHLLRLSALPQPASESEEREMLATLSSQLHFVRAVQCVDTTGVEPLRVIRDETAAGLREQTIGLAELREALDLEDVVGHAKRPRRRRTTTTTPHLGQYGKRNAGAAADQAAQNEEEAWDVLGGASETVGGRYFVVRSGGSSASSENAVG